MADRAFEYLREAIANRHLSGNGPFTRRSQEWLQREIGCARALLTHSGTAALEMAALLSGVGPGDEVIMPAFTFVSTANAFVLRGATPVFVDIRPDTLNIDETAIAAAITPSTRAIVAVHYGGVACEMDAILDLAARHGLMVIEDAAQALLSAYKGRPLGSFGRLAALSFHETKNVSAGEGGALIVNDPALADRAEIVWEKGTNRNAFFRGQVAKYSWVDVGSSFLPSEITAAFLWSQLETARELTESRLRLWHMYHDRCRDLEAAGLVRRPLVPSECRHNGHLYYLLTPSLDARTHALSWMNDRGVNAVFHYVPLHTSPAGRRYGRHAAPLRITEESSDRLLRLPLWTGLPERDLERVVETAADALRAFMPAG